MPTCLLKSVIHDWNEADARRILHTCRAAIGPTGRLLLIERVMPYQLQTTAQHRNIVRSDLVMMVVLGAQERTETEVRRLLADTGFAVRRLVPTASDFTIIEAVPVVS